METPNAIRTWLTDRLGLRYPVIQAPMAGGTTPPGLVAAVGNAGALGSFGFAYTDAAGMAQQVQAARNLTSAPIHINLFVEHAPQPPTEAQIRSALQALQPMYEALGVPVPATVEPPYAPSYDAQVEAAIALKPAVLSTHFGQLAPRHIEQAHEQGILIAASATNVEDAKHIESLGLDLIIAQGAEAGGHRGTFIGAHEDAMIGTLALTRLIVRNSKLPVVAAGGIMDGAGLAAVLALGACGAQIGTAFLPVDESGASQVHQQALFERGGAGTAITRAFSGRPARGIRNAFIERAEREAMPLLPFPIQNKATGPLRAAAAKQGKPEYVSLWAGQGYTLARRMSAADLVHTIATEYHEAAHALIRAARG